MSDYIDFKGRIMWPKVQEGYEDEYKGVKNYSVQLIVDDETLGMVRGAGLKRLKVREDSDGNKSVKFSRPYEKDFGKGVEKLGPPKVSIWNDVKKTYEDFDGIIGNGTLAKVNVKTYDFTGPDGKKGKGHQLMGVSILELKEYTPKTGDANTDKTVTPEEHTSEAKPW